MRPYVTFEYTNHRGERARRHVVVDSIQYLSDPGFGYAPGWFLSGHCLSKDQRRSFALVNIHPDSLVDQHGHPVNKLLSF